MQFERFDKKVNKIIERAYRLADFHFRQEVVVEDILRSICLAKGSVAVEVLKKSGLVLKKEDLDIMTELDQVEDLGTNKISLNSKVVQILNKALAFAMETRYQYVATEHLLLVLLEENDPKLDKILAERGVKIKELIANLKNVFLNFDELDAQDLFYNLDYKKVDQMVNNVLQNINMEENKIKQVSLLEKIKSKAGARSQGGLFLETVARDLTSQEEQKKIDPVVGRTIEIERIIQVLARRNKNNPILIGDPGVGKTAIVEGLAKKIVSQDVPDVLLDKRIYTLDLNALIAGSAVRGEFEQKLKQIIDEVSGNDSIILFIDEIHMIIGAGAVPGSMDAANILKPALARGDIRCIGATTYEDYKKNFADDVALERRFQSIVVEEPSLDEAVKILKGIKNNYENHHLVKITDEAIDEAVKLSMKYIPERFLPDKAIDLIDEAAAKVKMDAGASEVVKKIKQAEKKFENLVDQKMEAIFQESYEDAVEISKEEKEILDGIVGLEKEFEKIRQMWVGQIDRTDVRQVVAHMKQIPLNDLQTEDGQRLQDLSKVLKKNILGQNRQIEEIAFLVKKAKAGLANAKKPLASFCLVGPSGVGKTETARVLAREVFGADDKLIRFDMSEFSESFNISKLVGSPAGYVGYKEGGRLTEAVKRKPYSVVLFDEIEKAHPNVANLLLQILEEGELSDGSGKKISFRNTIIVATSNIGSDSEAEEEIGFEKDSIDGVIDEDKMKKVLAEYMSPELVGRFDKILIYNELDKKVIAKLVKNELERIKKQIKQQKNIEVKYDQEVVKYLVEKSFVAGQGAREVVRIVSREFESQLVDRILIGENINKLEVVIENDKIIVK